jgi:large subunit ribosomal protein L13
MQNKSPVALEKAVRACCQRPLGYAMIKNSCGLAAEHPHTAQQPKVLEIAGMSANAVRVIKDR